MSVGGKAVEGGPIVGFLLVMQSTSFSKRVSSTIQESVINNAVQSFSE